MTAADDSMRCADRAEVQWETAKAGARERAFAIRLRGLGHRLKTDYSAAIAAYGEALIEALNESRVLVLVFSSHSNESPQVMREVERAVSKGISILPFRIEDVPLCKEMEYYISTPHWLDALTAPMEICLGRLAQTATPCIG